MAYFTEANTIENAIRDTLTSLASAPPDKMMRDLRAAYTVVGRRPIITCAGWLSVVVVIYYNIPT